MTRFDGLTRMDRVTAELTRTQDTTHLMASVGVREPAGWVLALLPTVSRKSESRCGKILVISTTLIVSNQGEEAKSLGMTVVGVQPRTTPRAMTADQSALVIVEVNTIASTSGSRLGCTTFTDQSSITWMQEASNMVDTALLSRPLRLREVHSIQKTRSMFVILVLEPDICLELRCLAKDTKADQGVRVHL